MREKEADFENFKGRMIDLNYKIEERDKEIEEMIVSQEAREQHRYMQDLSEKEALQRKVEDLEREYIKAKTE